MHKIDLTTWKRKKHFNFFFYYYDPFYNICTEIDVKYLYDFCKTNKMSFFLSSLYLSQKAINSIEEFKVRIRNGQPYGFDKINATAVTIRYIAKISGVGFDAVTKNSYQKHEKMAAHLPAFSEKSSLPIL